MSIAPRETKCFSACTIWPGQSLRLGQRVQTSPSGFTVGVPHSGHFAGGTYGLLLAGAALGDRGHDLRDHVPGPHDDHLVALPDVLAGEVLLVVEGGSAHGHAADLDRLQHRVRDHVAGAADVHADLLQLRDRGRGRELEGDRPAGLAPDDAQLALRLEVVDLHDDAVDLEVEVLAPLLPGMACLDDRGEVVVQLDVAVHLEAVGAQPLERLEVGLEVEALAGADAVAPDRQGPRRCQLRVELADRAGGRVAGVRERALARGGALLVQPGEVGQRQVDLAANLQQRRGPFAVRRQRQRDRPDRPQVVGHVLPDLTVAPGGAADEHAVLVDERNRETVHLRLRHVLDRRRVEAAPLQRVVQALLPGAQLLLVPRVPERHHRDRVPDRVRSAAAAARRPAVWGSRACAAPDAPPRAPSARAGGRRSRDPR